MAIWLIDPFDTYDTAQITRLWDQKHATAAIISTANPRTGAQHMRFTRVAGTNIQLLTKTVNRSSASLTYGCAFDPRLAGANARLGITVFNGIDAECTLEINANGITAYRGTDVGTVLGTGAGWTANEYHSYEFGFTVSDGAGVIQVKMDGVDLINLTGLDTKATAVATPANITSLVFDETGWAVGDTVDMDDAHFEDTLTFHGDWKLELLTPTSDDLTEWTASSGGTHFDDVDEIPANDDTDYIEATAINQRDSFGFSNIAAVNPTIKCVQLMAMCKLPGAGTAQLSLYQRDAVPVEDASAAQAVATGNYRYAWVVQETDPIAGGAWTPTNVDARRFGVKRVTA